MSNPNAKKYLVLAAVDLNPGTSRVLEEALELAAHRPNGEVHAVCVVDPEIPVGFDPILLSRDITAAASVRAAELCEDVARKKTRELPRMPAIIVHVVSGAPVDEIVWLAAHLDADSIVMATHGRRGLKRLLLGSVAERVVRLAGCPVHVVRDKAHAAPWKVPEIEPTCPDCAVRRVETAGKQLWCDRHSERHVRAHVNHYTSRGEDAPHAWSSVTGT